MHLARERERVEHAADVARADLADLLLDARHLGVEERDVERGVVDDQLRAADEFTEFLENLGKPRLPPQELARQAVHLQRARVDLAVGTQVTVELPTGATSIQNLDGADFDDPVPELGFQPRSLGVEDDLSHATARASASTTRTCCSSVRYGCIGRLTTRRAAASEFGKSPSACPSPSNTGCMCNASG